MATTKTKTAKGKTKRDGAKAPKAPTKLEVAQAIAALTPEMFTDGNTPEALAKRSTVGDLDKMLMEAQAIADAKAAMTGPKGGEGLEDTDDAGEPQDITTGGPDSDTRDLEGGPAWPEGVVKGASVTVAENADGDPAFSGTVDEEDRDAFEVGVRDAEGSVWWVSPAECTVTIAPIGDGTSVLGFDAARETPAEPALDVAGDPLLAALGVTPENVGDFSDLIDPAHEARVDEAARAENRRKATASGTTTPAAPRVKAELPPVGTVLKHGLAGKAPQEARVVEGGVEFAGKVYPNLSQAAKAASTAAGHKHPATNGRGYWSLDAGTGAPRQPRAAKVSVVDTIKAERDALMASLEGLAPVIIAILTTREDTPIGATNINKMLQAWTQKHDTVWRPFAGSAVAPTPPPA